MDAERILPTAHFTDGKTEVQGDRDSIPNIWHRVWLLNRYFSG